MPPKVFVSYSHDTQQHADTVLALANRLRTDGVDVQLDQYLGARGPEHDWDEWMEVAIQEAEIVVVVPSQGYADKLQRKVAPGVGKGAKWEGAILRHALYNRESDLRRVAVALVHPDDKQHLVSWLDRPQHYRAIDANGRLDAPEYQRLLRHIFDEPDIEVPPVGSRPSLASRQMPILEEASDPVLSPVIVAAPSVQIDLPVPTNAAFVGREQEFQLLDDALASPDCRVQVLVAQGGEGKTRLAGRWLDRVEADGWRGMHRVYAMSFYSQGSSDADISTDAFFADALRFFGFMGELPNDPRERARQLVELVSAQPTLLVLDGLEPLQYPPGPQAGRLKDHAIALLLRRLARSGRGLCLVTTRVPVADVADAGGVRSWQLDALSPEDGAALLDQLGADGTLAERRDASAAVRHHAFALTLLGNYVRIALGGDVRRHSEADLADPDLDGAVHAGHLMDAYIVWFKKHGAVTEAALLRMMGLFDRPAPGAALKALLEKPAIFGLTENLVGMEPRMPFALERLASLGLLLPLRPGRTWTEQDIDAHPLVRQYFGKRLHEEVPKVWQKGHLRLYQHFRNAAPDLPGTAEAMAPLWAAVGHGCKAGRWEEALVEVYQRRILRGEEGFATKKLGAFAQDLGCIANFFGRRWGEPVADLPESLRRWLLNAAGLDLRALGRLRDAGGVLRSAVELAVQAEDWLNAARGATSLSEIHLAGGAIASAEAFARQSLARGDRSEHIPTRIGTCSGLANALAQAGVSEEAQRWFSEAERLQNAYDQQFQHLYSLQGFQYCDLLMQTAEQLVWPFSMANRNNREQSTCVEVLTRAERALTISTKHQWLLAMALDHLSIGRAHQGLWQIAIGNAPADAAAAGPHRLTAKTHFHRATAALNASGSQDYLALGLLHRATFHRLDGNFTLASADLDEAFDLAEPCGMLLHVTDAHLGYAWLDLAEGHAEAAEEHRAKAYALVQQTGYHRRDEELAALAAAVAKTRTASMPA